MLDFASAHYLGLAHPARSLPGWSALTTGLPAALDEPRRDRRLAAALARLLGVDRALLARSTLHAFWDLFGALPGQPGQVLVDGGTYPVGRWGAQRAALRGARVATFPHHDARALQRILERTPGSRSTWILTDGLCGGCGRVAPLRAYAALAARHGALLVVDDTQGLGLLGRSGGPRLPFGQGGGGALAWAGVSGPSVAVVASLAKALGAPLAVVGGPKALLDRLAVAGDTRVHCSPPSAADVAAGVRALEANQREGDGLRARLSAMVARLREGLGLGPAWPPFPVQRLPLPPGLAPAAVHAALASQGVRAVLRRPACAPRPELALVLSARHRTAEIDRALLALDRTLASLPATREAA